MNRLNLFFTILLAGFIFLTSCSEKTQHDERFGQSKTIELSATMDSIPEGRVMCIFFDSEAGLRAVEATHEKLAEGSRFNLSEPLSIGPKVFAAAVFDTPEGKRKSQVGCSVAIGEQTNQGNSETFTKSMGMFGDGTEGSPFCISSEDGFVLLRMYMQRKGDPCRTFFFKQMCEIAFADYTQPGFIPIADESGFYGPRSIAFGGTFDGNGHKISYMQIIPTVQDGMSEEDMPGPVGLFSTVAGATFNNIVIEKAYVRGVNAVGALVGCVTTSTENKATVFNNCKVLNSKLSGSDYMGSLVGYCEQPANVVFSQCVSEGNTLLSSDNSTFIGGILGGGGANTSVQIMNSYNNTSITNGSLCLGGLVGGASTLMIQNCVNEALVTSSKSGIGIGGLVGGTACYSTIVASENKGGVSAPRFEGVGGILGSTMIVADEGIYSDVAMNGVANSGQISGLSSVGGIVGESQGSFSNCYNFAAIQASGDLAGGIMGFAPAMVVNGCHNTGKVTAKECSGGIVSVCDYYILLNSANYGAIQGGKYTAGIIASGGATGFLNYCANYGSVSGGSEYMAGIIGKAGTRYQPSTKEIVSTVLTTTLGVSSGTLQVVSVATGSLSRVSNVVGKIATIYTVSSAVVGGIQKVVSMFQPHQIEIVPALSTFSQADVSADVKEKTGQYMDRLKREYPILYTPRSITGIDTKLIADQTFNNVLNIQTSVDNIPDGNDQVAYAVQGRLAEIDKSVSNCMLAEKIVVGVLKGVCALGGFVMGKCKKSALQTTSGGLSITGGLLSLTDLLLKTDYNCIEVTQCANFGNVSGSQPFGVIGYLGDWVRFSNSFGVGLTNGGYSVANQYQQHAKNIYGLGNGLPFKEDSGNSKSTVFYSAEQCGVSESKHALSAEKLRDKSTFEDYPSDIWDKETVSPPVFKNSLVYSYR